MPEYPAMLAYLTLHLPASASGGLLRLDVARTLVDAEGWLGWARRVVANEGGGYTLGVQRESVVEVWQKVKEMEGERDDHL